MPGEKDPLLPVSEKPALAVRTKSELKKAATLADFTIRTEEDEVSKPSSVYQLIGCVSWIALGVGFACYFEGWTVVTGLYVITQIVTTVGYGDVTVTSQHGKLFCGLYVVVTVVFLATYVTELASTAFGNQEELLRKQLRRAEASVHRKQRNTPSNWSSPPNSARDTESGALTDEDMEDMEIKMKYGVYNQAAVAFLIFLCFVLFGTIFFASYEGCTCSYGVSAIEGCVDKLCAQTGGYTKTYTDSFYMSLITLTTVGFGDNTPKSWVGRIIGCFWMIFGVVSCANMAGKFAEVLMQKKKEHQRLKKMSRQVFDRMDVNHDGVLSKSEFRVFALIKFGIVTRDSLDRIDYLFKKMDQNHDGKLTFEEVESYQKVI